MNVRVEGTATISGLTVASGKEIKVSDNQLASDVNIGDNIVQVYDNANHGYTFTATTGMAIIRNQNVTNFSSVTLNGKDLGTPTFSETAKAVIRFSWASPATRA